MPKKSSDNKINEKNYSLKDIFQILRDATSSLYEKKLFLVTEDKDGNDIEIEMNLPDYIAMSVGHQIHTTTNSDKIKGEVIDAMTAVGYDDPDAHPNYESFGIRMNGGKRKYSRKTRKSKSYK
jgi:hypothetical protein